MRNYILISTLNFILSYSVYASTPLWTFTPLTPTTIVISPTQVKFVDYLITNKSSITHNLALQPLRFRIVDTDPSNCKEVFTLAPNQSCILSILIQGISVKDSYRGGPVVCENGSQVLCYVPSGNDILTVIFN